MKPERWKEIERVFEAALDRSAAERESFLEQTCGDDTELLAEVRRLLSAQPPAEFIEPMAPVAAEQVFAVGLSGRDLGQYRLLREIGRGGMGVVYLARHEAHDQLVALKLLPPAHAKEEARVRFEREISAASSLDHPAIIPVLAHGESEGVAWYAMRFVEGHDLHDELRAQRDVADGTRASGVLLPRFTDPMFLPTVAARVADLADGLQTAHDGGVVHRDIKPKNILLDDRGHVFLTDFGLARDARFGTITASSAIQGTPYYMSPEQARALKVKVDHRTDIYSLCVVLFEMLTLRVPFEGKTPQEVVERIGRGATTDVRSVNPRVPRDLALICNKGMSRNPSARYSSAQELAKDLRRFLRHEAIMAKPLSARERLGNWTARNQRALVALLAVLVALALGVQVRRWTEERASASALADRIRLVLQSPDWDADVARIAALRSELAARPSSSNRELSGLVEEFGRRLSSFRAETLDTCESWIADGKGGQLGLEEYRPYSRPSSARQLSEGLSLAQRLSIVFPEDSRVRSLASIEASFPLLEVQAVIVHDDGSSRAVQPGEAQISIAPVDPIHDKIGEERSLGTAPLAATPIAPGYYRIRVRVDSFGHSDLMRLLEPTIQVTTAVARIHRRESTLSDMLAIPAGHLRLAKKRAIGCLLLDDGVDVEAFHLEPQELSNERFVRFLQASGHPVPSMWATLGYVDDWHNLPVSGFEDVWLELPVTGISALDARACAEWYGKRLPRHTELELALDSLLAGEGRGGLAVPLADIQANIHGTRSDSIASDDHRGLYRHYLENALPVRDASYRQGPLELYHLFGNVDEMTSSLMVEADDPQIRVATGARVTLGRSWESSTTGPAIGAHAWAYASSKYYSFALGVRLAY